MCHQSLDIFLWMDLIAGSVAGSGRHCGQGQLKWFRGGHSVELCLFHMLVDSFSLLLTYFGCGVKRFLPFSLVPDARSMAYAPGSIVLGDRSLLEAESASNLQFSGALRCEWPANEVGTS